MAEKLEQIYEGKHVEIAGRSATVSRVTPDHTAYFSRLRGMEFAGKFDSEQLATFGYEALTNEEALEGQDYPKVGDEIYVGTHLYLSHGRDDFLGGLCTVIHVGPGVSAGEVVPFIEVAERPGWRTNWIYLAAKQDELKERFGDQRGHADPDLRPEFNEP